MADFMGTIKGFGVSALTWTIFIILGLIILAILTTLGIWLYRRKRWNLRVECKIPRSDGNITLSEKAKGHYDIAAGIVDIKRKGLKAVGMKPFDVKEYLQGADFLDVMQVSATEYIPIHPKSYEKVNVKDAVSGEIQEFAVMKLRSALSTKYKMLP